ncbi:MAG TPA: ATP-binding protein [Solirubrobacteraceae bacterium]
MLDDARLVASELVNNAVLHSGCAPDDIIRVAAQLDDGFLIISVHNPGVAPLTEERCQAEGNPERVGFGLRVVQHLAARWGIESPDEHRVWAALALSPS